MPLANKGIPLRLNYVVYQHVTYYCTPRYHDTFVLKHDAVFQHLNIFSFIPSEVENIVFQHCSLCTQPIHLIKYIPMPTPT